MKIIITESQYKNIISELDPRDVQNIKMGGDEIIEEYEAGPYTVFLTRHKYMGMHKIGLTTTGTPCTFPQPQFKKTPCVSQKDIIDAYRKIAPKVSSWIEEHGKMFIASWNEKKVLQYKRMFERMGFKCSNIRKFMDGIMFQVDKTEEGIEDYGF